MKVIEGDLFEQEADAICITTNGTLRKDGRCVMGKGCALGVVKRFPGIDKILGDRIATAGNHIYCLRMNNAPHIYSFPVKHHWAHPADIVLIARSARELLLITRVMGYKNIVIPRPGCGAGGLSWEVVGPVLQEILDDRFKVITWGDK
jgi:O-acetyl-ADP-ribose deacetylase (regulator of RNase III)